MYKGDFKISMQEAIRSISVENPDYTFPDSMKWDEKFRIPKDIFDPEFEGSLNFLDWFLSVWPKFSRRYHPNNYGDYYKEEITHLDGVYEAAMRARENLDIRQCAMCAEDLFSALDPKYEKNIDEAQESLVEVARELSASHTRVLQMLSIRHLEASLGKLARAIQWE